MGPGEDIAQGVPAGLAKMNPIGGMMGAAQGGGQQLLQLIMQLLQGQQQPPVPFAGQPPVPPQQAPGLKGKILGQY